MKINPLKKGAITDKSAGIGTVTRDMVEQRAIEIAVINGRSRRNVLESDWQEAKRELTGGQEIDRQEAMLESVPESEEWDPLPGSQGRKVFESASEDEDDEGVIDAAHLFEEGMEEAEHERMLEATEPPRRSRRRKHRWNLRDLTSAVAVIAEGRRAR
jgi:hypothetical protein